MVLSAIGFLVVFGVLIGLLPSPGNLGANIAHANQFGYARASTETPQPITNILSTPLVIDGKTIAPGQIVYPGSTRTCCGSSAGTPSSTSCSSGPPSRSCSAPCSTGSSGHTSPPRKPNRTANPSGQRHNGRRTRHAAPRASRKASRRPGPSSPSALAPPGTDRARRGGPSANWPGQPEPLLGRIESVRRALAASAGRPAEEIPLQGRRFHHPPRPDRAPDRAGPRRHRRPPPASICGSAGSGGRTNSAARRLCPSRLRAIRDRPARLRSPAGNACHLLLDNVIAPITAATSDLVPVSGQVLWGNIASAVNGAANQLAGSGRTLAAKHGQRPLPSLLPRSSAGSASRPARHSAAQAAASSTSSPPINPSTCGDCILNAAPSRSVPRSPASFHGQLLPGAVTDQPDCSHSMIRQRASSQPPPMNWIADRPPAPAVRPVGQVIVVGCFGGKCAARFGCSCGASPTGLGPHSGRRLEAGAVGCAPGRAHRLARWTRSVPQRLRSHAARSSAPTNCGAWWQSAPGMNATPGERRGIRTVAGPGRPARPRRGTPRGLPVAVAAAVTAFLTGALLDNPHRVGKPLARELARYNPRGAARTGWSTGSTSPPGPSTSYIDHRADVYRTR